MTPERREAAEERVAVRRLNAEQRVIDRALGPERHSQQFIDERATMRAEQGARDQEIEERRQREQEAERRGNAAAAPYAAMRETRRLHAEQEAARVYEAQEQYQNDYQAALERLAQAEVQANLHRRFAQLVVDRKLDFSAPRTEGNGWASSRFATAALDVARRASSLFLECTRLNLAVEEERARLGGLGASPPSRDRQTGQLLADSALRDLHELRSQLELAEIHFERAYAELEAWRAKATRLDLLAQLAEGDELAAEGAFENYLEGDLPEVAEIKAAVEQYCKAAFALIERHSARIELSSRARAAAKAAGVAPSMSFLAPDGDMYRPLSIDATERFVQRAAEETARALFAGSGIPNHFPQNWFPFRNEG